MQHKSNYLTRPKRTPEQARSDYDLESGAIYITICKFSDGEWITENAATYSREALIKDIMEAQYDNLAKVIRISLRDNTAEDVSAEIRDQVLQRFEGTAFEGQAYLPEFMQD